MLFVNAHCSYSVMGHCIPECRMNSIIGRICCEKYGINVDSMIKCTLSVNVIDNLFFAILTDNAIITIEMVRELIVYSTFNLCKDLFDRTDINLY